MLILKAPPKQPKNATLQLRVDEGLKIKSHKYAEFLDSTESYAVSGVLKLVFNKDAELKDWLGRQEANGKESTGERVSVPTEKRNRQTAFAPSSPEAIRRAIVRKCSQKRRRK
jgi:hypothetical protein